MTYSLCVLVAHKLLWTGNGKRRVEHTDISFGNFGVDPKTLDIKLRGFDLARVVGAGAPGGTQSRERMGTIPFMALDLLTSDCWEGNVKRLYRHDLEGFVWVVVAYAWLYDENGVAVKISPVQDWFTCDYNACRKEKNIFLFRRPIPLPLHADRTEDVMKYAAALLSFIIDSIAQEWKIRQPEATRVDKEEDALASYQEFQKITEDALSRVAARGAREAQGSEAKETQHTSGDN